VSVFFLSPAKLLVILVVALLVLGPDKLPKVARQIGGLWGDFRKLRDRLESEVRGTFPDLPSTDKISQAVRSPLSLLDTLADSHKSENGTTSATSNGSEPPDVLGEVAEAPSETPANRGLVTGDPGTIVHRVRTSGGVVPDDPGLN
jgi:TatA/E family protein of Tat protein translocase